MADPLTVRIDSELREAAERVPETDGPSAGLRKLAREGAASRGYLNGHAAKTRLREGVRFVGATFLLVALLWIGVSYFTPVAWRLPAVGFIISGLFAYGFDWVVLQRYEPGISERLGGVGA